MTCIACADAPGLAGVRRPAWAPPRARTPWPARSSCPSSRPSTPSGEGDYAGAAGRLEALAPSLGRLSEFPDQLGVFHETQRRARALAGA